MQLLPLSMRSLNGLNSELKNHFFEFDRADAFDPNLNIAAGVRWLFQKKALLEMKLKGEATWSEVIEDYKGYTKLRKKDPSAKMPGMSRYRDRLLKMGGDQ